MDMNAFLDGAQVLVMKSETLKDGDGNALDAKYTLSFWSDADDLLAKYGDPEVTNKGEIFTVKVLGQSAKAIVRPKELDHLVNPIGKIWGDYRNNLSVTADDVILVKEAD